uniref:Kidney associated antigen 1 n=1 Tax=Prolemur simus TaxID=1328070 RepID=A0A8C9DJF6_PROSS
MEDDAAPREEGVPVAVHQHALDDRLRQVAGPGAGAAHLPRGTLPQLASRGDAPPLPGRPRRTHSAGSPPETNGKLTDPRGREK